ncbi:MBL fold metallo-hydrolase [Candidatus Bandiella woodruffii]|uniref:MBL fold metallo-hydrolase n=2 Tax=Candidatus Bandiella euplotis TaxID=1664265 RepID=A0ABZ0UP22_9RICK|nr:MBL fold metallo-hydrolase [Candidatus Bandiella woodruffii]
MLLNEAKGSSLESFYERVPDMLKGFVELVYDLNNHPSIRLMESLIYRFYYTDNHQEIALSKIDGDFRKFVFSTPRVRQDDEIYLQIPFSDQRWDVFFKHRQYPCELQDLIKLLDITDHQAPLFESFFTTDIPKQNDDRNYQGDGVRIRYFGHACVLVETASTSILFDPVISYAVENNIPRYSFDDLPDSIDYVVITHSHLDHVMFETLLQLRHKVRNIVFPSNQKGTLADPSLKLILKHVGFGSLLEMDELETIKFTDGEILTIPFLGEHCDLNIRTKLSYCVNIRGKRLLFAADSNNLAENLYDHIFNITGPIEMLFIGMECEGAPLTWVYGALLTNQLSREFDRSRTLCGSNCSKAWSIIQKLKCKQVYVYAMGQEPWLNHVMGLNYSPDSPQIIESDNLISMCRKNDIESERLFGKKEWLINI